MINKQAYVQHVPGHLNSKGEHASWVVRSHETGKILSSHKTKNEAQTHLQQMEMHKSMAAELTYSEITKQAELNVPKALEEVQSKSTEEINRDTAYTWGSRAAACFELAEKANDEKEKDRLLARALDFRHESLEHASLVEDGGKLVGEIQNLVKVKVSTKEAAKTDATQFTSVLEDVVQKIQSDCPNLAVAKRLVIDKVQASNIRQEDKDTIIRTVEEAQHVMPVSMKDNYSLVGYLFNSILKYKGLGVIKKQENVVPYNGNTPADTEVDPQEIEDTGYGGDREGMWGSPKRSQMKATATQNLGTIKKGDLVVITGFRKDKVFFYAEQDPTLVGIAPKNMFSFYPDKRATSFLQIHATLSKSSSFITKLATDFGGLVDPSVLDRLQEIKDTVSTNKDRVMNQLPVSPIINANLRMADAAQYFSMKGVVPTQKDTIQYIKASMAAHTDLPEDNWSDEVVKQAILNRKTATSLDWSDKLLLMQQWHLAGTLAQSIWEELLKLLDSNDLNEIRTGIEMLFSKASDTVKKPETKTAEAIPPAPTTPPPAGKKYMWDAPSTQYVLVDASYKEVSNTLKGN